MVVLGVKCYVSDSYLTTVPSNNKTFIFKNGCTTIEVYGLEESDTRKMQNVAFDSFKADL